MDISQTALRNQESYRSQCVPFRQVFGQNLKKFWGGPILGLDIIKLDGLISPDNGESLHDAILRKHGKAGVSIVKTLLDVA